MFGVILFLFLFSQIGSSIHVRDSASFEEWSSAFGAKFKGEELAKRKAIFEVERAKVIKHNSNPKKRYTQALNEWSALSKEEVRETMMGYSKNLAHNHKHSAALLMSDERLKQRSVKDLPESVDWRTVPNVVTAVKNQGRCGSCWAFAATATLESHVAIASGKLNDLSPQQFVNCAPNPNMCGGIGGCQGSTASLAYEYLAKSSPGMYDVFTYPYYSFFGKDDSLDQCKVNDFMTMDTPVKPLVSISGYSKASAVSTEWLMNAVATLGPLAVNVDATGWKTYKSGVFDGCSQQNSLDINHVVVLVGYGVEPQAGANSTEGGMPYWLIRNSWTANFGDNGYIKLKRGMNDASDNCIIDNTPEDGVECQAGGKPGPVEVCGECGLLYSVEWPIGVAQIDPSA